MKPRERSVITVKDLKEQVPAELIVVVGENPRNYVYADHITIENGAMNAWRYVNRHPPQDEYTISRRVAACPVDGTWHVIDADVCAILSLEEFVIRENEDVLDRLALSDEMKERFPSPKKDKKDKDESTEELKRALGITAMEAEPGPGQYL